MQEMANEVEQWCKRAARKERTGRHIIITGPFGCGKTKCLKAAKKFMSAASVTVWPQYWTVNPPMVWSVDWPEFVGQQIEVDTESMRDLLASDVVFLDDIGAEEDRFKSGQPTRILAEILSKMEGRFVFITTNIKVNHWRERWDARVEDRLLRNTVVVNLWKPDAAAESYAAWRMRNQ